MRKMNMYVLIIFAGFILINTLSFAVSSGPIQSSDESETTFQRGELKIRNWTLGSGIQWAASSEKAYKKSLKAAGFGGREHVGNGFFGKYEPVADPQIERPGYRYYFYLERRIREPFSIGALYTQFKGAELEGWDHDVWHEIHMTDEGNGYYIYGLAQSDITKALSSQIALGVGAMQVTYIAELHGWLEAENSIGPNLSAWSPGAYVSAGVDIILFNTLIIGSRIHYWYTPPLVVDSYTINYRGFLYEFNERKFNFGGFGVGIIVGMRPF